MKALPVFAAITPVGLNIDHEQKLLTMRICEKEIKSSELDSMLNKLQSHFNDPGIKADLDKITNQEDSIDVAIRFTYNGNDIGFD